MFSLKHSIERLVGCESQRPFFVTWVGIGQITTHSMFGGWFCRTFLIVGSGTFVFLSPFVQYLFGGPLPFFYYNTRHGARTFACSNTACSFAFRATCPSSCGRAVFVVSRWDVRAVFHATLLCSCFLVFCRQLLATFVFAFAHGVYTGDVAVSGVVSSEESEEKKNRILK